MPVNNRTCQNVSLFRIFRISLCTAITAIAFGCLLGLYEAFHDHDTIQIAAAYRNWPYLILIWAIAIGSWFAR